MVGVVSQTLIVTFPLVIFRMLKPTVGIISSLNCPDCRKNIKVVIDLALITDKSLTYKIREIYYKQAGARIECF